MQLSKKAVEEFRDIYEEKIGEKISYNKAKRKATSFLKLFKILHEPYRKSE